MRMMRPLERRGPGRWFWYPRRVNASPEPTPRVSDEFCQPVTPRAEDMDDLGHVSNLVYLRFVLEIARAHSAAVGWDHAAYVRHGAVFVVRKHEIEYLAPTYAGEALTVTTWIESWSAATSVRCTRIVRDRDAREVARAATLWVMVSTESIRPRRIPAEVRDAFTASGIALAANASADLLPLLKER
jgi:acyl-CoA thioester hydrolase